MVTICHSLATGCAMIVQRYAEQEGSTMGTLTRFTMPEATAAFSEWSRRTGLGWDAPEWGEVLAALDSCDLLAFERMPQQALFDAPGAGDDHASGVLRAAVVASARLVESGTFQDPATGVQVVVAALEAFDYGLGADPFEQVVTRLEVELPRRVGAICSTPSDALTVLLRTRLGSGVERLPVLVRRVLWALGSDDEFARRVFDRLSTVPEMYPALLPLCDGRFLLYDTTI